MSQDRQVHSELTGGEIADWSSAPPAACAFLSLNGSKLAVWSARSFPLAGTVKVTAANHLWIGEVWACEPSSDGFQIEIEVSALLNDVQSVADLAARFRHERTIRTGEASAGIPAGAPQRRKGE